MAIFYQGLLGVFHTLPHFAGRPISLVSLAGGLAVVFAGLSLSN